MRKVKFVSVLVAVVSGLFFAGAVYAANYLGSGYFPTSNLYRCHIGNYYASQAQYASGTWSATTDLSMYYSCPPAHMWSSGYNYGATGWAGSAYICATNGQCNNQSAFNTTYSYCLARLNEYYLRNNSYDSIKAIALHEMGHCYSLGHRWVTNSVMYPYASSVLQPNPTDRYLINARY